MRPGTIVVALGGNALQPAGQRVTIAEQFRHTRESLVAVVALARAGWHLAIVHGNGPQVGDALARNEQALDRVEPLPLGLLVASTAGWIGYMIQQSLQNAFEAAGIAREVLTIITQTVVDVTDPAGLVPVKPVGNVLTADEAAALTARGVPVGPDGSGRPRRLAPSPRPVDLVESASVKRLVDEGHVVIAAGGGGTPVYRDRVLRWEGVDAVVDKDRVAAILAHRLAADALLILTDVDAVHADWGKPSARPLTTLSLDGADQLLAGTGLGAGSMRPKLEAAAEFVRRGGARAVIGHLAQGLEALRGETGTTITRE
ncbi:MAG: carbamate kinase [Gemmatimonadales bacterium]